MEQPFRIHYLSDMHLEFPRFPPFTLTKTPPPAPYLALCGDVSTVNGAALAKFDAFLTECAPRYQHVFLIAGNHEPYGAKSLEDTFRIISELCAKHPNVHFLNPGSFLLPGGWRILGATLWSYVPPGRSRRNVANCLNDYNLIQTTRPIPRELLASRPPPPPGTLRPLLVEDTVELHEAELAFLQTEIAKAEQAGEKVVVLSHHYPFPSSNPLYPSGEANCAFESDLRAMMKPPIRAWLCGHTHYSRQDSINGVYVGSNQVCYPNEKDPPPYQIDRVYDSSAPLPPPLALPQLASLG